MEKEKVGIVGLGLMGYNIGINLMNKGFEVYGYDISKASCERFAAAGGKTVNTCAELGSAVKTVILMVFNAEQIKSVLFGDEALVSTLSSGSTVIVTASVGHEVMDEAYKYLENHNIMLVDAAVRASSASAAEGTMYIMVGATDDAYASASPLLHAMGNEIIRVGNKPGTAQIAKSCMQAFFSLTFEATAEVLALGTAAGLDPKVVYDILNATGASSNLFRATAKNIASRTFTDTKNPMSILEKDAKLAVRLAKEHNMDLLALEGTAKNFEDCMRNHSTEDIWACVKHFEESANIEVKFDTDK